MPTVALKAHYNGSQILLDEPFELAPDTPLMVLVIADAGESQKAAPVESTATPYQLAMAMGLVGAFEGPSDLAANHADYLKEKLRAPRPD